jgi:hypothetical protein
MKLTDKTKEKFEEWYWENFNCQSGIEHWLEADQLLCYSKFFGFTVDTIEKLNKANRLYNVNYRGD